MEAADLFVWRTFRSVRDTKVNYRGFTSTPSPPPYIQNSHRGSQGRVSPGLRRLVKQPLITKAEAVYEGRLFQLLVSGVLGFGHDHRSGLERERTGNPRAPPFSSAFSSPQQTGATPSLLGDTVVNVLKKKLLNYADLQTKDGLVRSTKKSLNKSITFSYCSSFPNQVMSRFLLSSLFSTTICMK